MDYLGDLHTIEEADRALYHALNGLILDGDGDPYRILGHQPDTKALAELDKGIPLIWIKRMGPPEDSDIGSSSQSHHEVSSLDENGKPATYTELSGDEANDLSYELRYIAFSEQDERLMMTQLFRKFPKRGVTLYGPGGQGPVYFDRVTMSPLSGTREKELAGMIRVVARHVYLGIVEGHQVAAITDVNNVFNDEGSTSTVGGVSDNFEDISWA